MITELDRTFLKQTLDLAKTSLELGTYPIAAILAATDGTGHWVARNRVYEIGDITAHAEMMLLRDSGVGLRIMKGDYTIYCTMEPCSMCISAIRRSLGISRVVCLIDDPSWGGIRTMRPFYSVLRDFRRALGINVGADEIKLGRVSPSTGFLVEFSSESDELVLEAKELWTHWLAVAATAKGKWN